jgi:hypothetical protein
MIMTSILVGAVLPSVAQTAATYNFTGLSSDDILTIGRGLDKLPREDTDRNNLWGRLQQQITAQNAAMAKDAADAQKAAIAKAAEDLAKGKGSAQP